MKAAKILVCLMRFSALVIMLIFLVNGDVPRATMFLVWFLFFTIMEFRLENKG